MMTVYRINDYDMVVEDRTNGLVRVVIFNRNESLEPTSWVVKYGKRFVEDMTTMVMYRSGKQFKSDFIEYCKKYNIFQEILESIEKEVGLSE